MSRRTASRIALAACRYCRLSPSFAEAPRALRSADFAAYVRDEIAKWKRIIEVGKIDGI